MGKQRYPSFTALHCTAALRGCWAAPHNGSTGGAPELCVCFVLCVCVRACVHACACVCVSVWVVCVSAPCRVGAMCAGRLRLCRVLCCVCFVNNVHGRYGTACFISDAINEARTSLPAEPPLVDFRRAAAHRTAQGKDARGGDEPDRSDRKTPQGKAASCATTQRFNVCNVLSICLGQAALKPKYNPLLLCSRGRVATAVTTRAYATTASASERRGTTHPIRIACRISSAPCSSIAVANRPAPLCGELAARLGHHMRYEIELGGRTRKLRGQPLPFACGHTVELHAHTTVALGRCFRRSDSRLGAQLLLKTRSLPKSNAPINRFVTTCACGVDRTILLLYAASSFACSESGATDEPEDPDHSAKIILGEASVFSKQSAMHMSHSPDEAVLVMVRTFHTVAATPPDTAGAVAVAVADGCSCNCAADAPIPPILCPTLHPRFSMPFLSLLMDHSALCSAHVRARTFGSGRAHHRRMHHTWCRRCRRLRCSRCIGLTTTALARRIKSRR